MPLTLRGEHGEQARATEVFVEALRSAARCPGRDVRRAIHDGARAIQSGGRAPEDAVAAAHLLQGWLERAR